VNESVTRWAGSTLAPGYWVPPVVRDAVPLPIRHRSSRAYPQCRHPLRLRLPITTTSDGAGCWSWLWVETAQCAPLKKYSTVMEWSRAFTELVLYFAARVATVDGISLDAALLTATPLYPNFKLGTAFDASQPAWHEFLAGFHDPADPVAWTYAFYLALMPGTTIRIPSGVLSTTTTPRHALPDCTSATSIPPGWVLSAESAGRSGCVNSGRSSPIFAGSIRRQRPSREDPTPCGAQVGSTICRPIERSSRPCTWQSPLLRALASPSSSRGDSSSTAIGSCELRD